jgi:AmmeMemoRadiSam system protein B
MSKRLPKLRTGIDIFPSPLEDRPGLLIRDPFCYTDEILIIPPLLARGLIYFDGEQTEIDLQAHLSQLIGQIVPSENIGALIEALDGSGFLETPTFENMREQRQAEFAAADVRLPAHAGAAYPDQIESLRATLETNLGRSVAPSTHPAAKLPLGLAAPHVSPVGGWSGYKAAYNRLTTEVVEELTGRTVVILGTSHYGRPEKFGVTRKPFLSPFGITEVDTPLLDRLIKRAPRAIIEEDYCHSIEHSIEFQCVFLQYKLGVDFKILPILCGPFVEALMSGDPPERNEDVGRFFDALGEMADQERERLFWVLGIDLAHIGSRYGDRLPSRAYEGEMIAVRGQDEERLAQICAGNARGFHDLVHPNRDPLKWCGVSPLYTMLASHPNLSGQVLAYDQWNIDEQSVVSYAALEFNH